MRYKKNLIIISSFNPKYNSVAAMQRLKLYAKALLLNGVGVKYVYFNFWDYSISNYIQSGGQVILSKSRINRTIFFYKNIRLLYMDLFFFDKRCTSYLFYPTHKFLIDSFILLLFKIKNKRSIYYELNEVRKYSVTTIYSISLLLKSPLKFTKKFIKKSMAAFNEKLYKYYTGIIVISSKLNNYPPTIGLNKILIPILCELDSNGKTSKKILENNNNSFKIGFFGTVNITKENLDIFLSALSKIKTKHDFIFDLFGICANENKASLMNFITNYNLSDSVTYKGLIKGEDVKNRLKEYDLLVLPRGNTKQNMYGFSTKLAEYLVSGVPTLLTDVSDNSLYIKDNFNGFIIPPDNEQAFVKKLDYIINNYENIAEKIAQNAYNTALRHFDYRNYSNLLTNFFFPDNNE